MGLDLNKVVKNEILPQQHEEEGTKVFVAPHISKKSRFSDVQKERFFNELGILLEAKISLKDALASIALAEKRKKSFIAYQQMAEKLTQGTPFYLLLKEQGSFSAYEWVAVKIGEESGFLFKVIQSLALFYKRKIQLKQQFFSALLYPSMILITSLVVVVFMLYTIVPMFSDIFEQNKVELPTITKMVIRTSELIVDHGFYLLFFLTVLIFVYSLIYKKKAFKRRWDYFIIKIPFLGKFIKTNHTARFFQAMGLLTGARVNLIKSLNMTHEMIEFSPFRNAIDKLRKDILKGHQIHQSMQETQFFDPSIVSFVKVGESTHQLDMIFDRIFEYTQERMFRIVKRWTTILEPLLIVFVGLIVALILISMYLPMFRLSTILE